MQQAKVPYRWQNPHVWQVQQMLHQGIVQPSTSPWAATAEMARKKDGTRCFCEDYRLLNNATIKDAHPLPRNEDTLESLHGAWISYTLDLKAGYWQISVNEDHRAKTAFHTSSGNVVQNDAICLIQCSSNLLPPYGFSIVRTGMGYMHYVF